MALRTRTTLLSIVATGALALGVGGFALTATAAAADPLISQNKPVTTSSNENSTLTGPKAVDANASTRWGSVEGKDPQWIRVDLGASFHVSRVVLKWEAAFGKAYQIQVSEDDQNWMDAFSTTSGNGGTDDLTLDTNGRFIRMFGTKRGTAFGYSLFEFEVFGSNGGPVDRTPPSVPPNFRQVGSATPTQIDVAWDAATDNVGVQLYEVYNGGTKIKTVGGNQLATSLTNLTPNTNYQLTVLARDAAGNPSQASNALNITTPKSDDTTPPTVPTGLKSTTVDADSITLVWNASTDASGVLDYDVFRNGTVVATVPDTTATDSGLTANTSFSYTVAARDINGNVSKQSPAITVKTSPGGGGGGLGGDPIFDHDIAKVDLAWAMAFLPDGNALATERDRHELLRVTPGGQKTVVATVPNVVGTNGEGGLLGLAISPTYNSDHFIFMFHTSPSDNRVERYTFQNGTLSAGTPVVTGIAKNQFHNGGRLKFGPDGFLYVTTGDAKNGSNAQNLSSLNGKILRVDKDGKAAPGNPFNSRVYSYGHRNVQGIAWDSRGQLWESEFGEGNLDELNLIKPGKNYGWPTCEGPCGNPKFVDPIRTWDVAAASPSGLEIVNDWLYMAAVRGSRLWVMHINSAGTGTDTPRAFFNGRWGRLRDVVKSPDGGLWLSNTNNDKLGGSPNVIDNVIVRLKFAGGGGGGGGGFALTSSAFADNGNIPTKYTCQQDGKAGNDISPALSWGPGSNSPKSYAIILVDTGNGNKHWAIWDLPAATTSLPEGLGLGFAVPGQSPAKQKALGSGNQTLQYFGPCPGGSSHKYVFTLYALKVATLPGLSQSSTVAQVETAAKANAMASVTLSGNSAAHT
jgi:Raf kinase inhibitor-like YbhB/YbcL family protein